MEIDPYHYTVRHASEIHKTNFAIACANSGGVCHKQADSREDADSDRINASTKLNKKA